jgi:hypothetical protein
VPNLEVSVMTRTATPFKGNKQSLPSKSCVTCGREMTWRKKWAKNWNEVKVCSDACRRSNSRTAASSSSAHRS